MNNIKGKEVAIKLPISEASLEHSLLTILLFKDDMLGYKNYDTEFMSVINIIRVKNITINKPTNIYYLNLYLNILKEKRINLPSEYMTITTDILKEKIAVLIGASNKSMNYNEIKQFINKGDKTKKTQKPMFNIKSLQKKHIERKANT